jgi:Arc/MetJ family transcription regulator
MYMMSGDETDARCVTFEKWKSPEMSSFGDKMMGAEANFMRTTVALDDELVRTAQEYTGVTERTALLREALKALIHIEASRRLAALGGTMPDLKDIPRRRASRS